MDERFTDGARTVMVHGYRIIQHCGHEFVHAEHVLLALFGMPKTAAQRLLKDSGVDIDSAGRALAAQIRSPEYDGPDRPATAKRVIEGFIREARDLDHDYVGTEHLLLALLREADGLTASILAGLGLAYGPTRERVLALHVNPDPPGPPPPLDRPSSPD